jgi:putative hydrolase of the HAD superfamily
MSAAPALQSFAHVTDWVFDLDNTLYPRTCNLFAQIDALITQYVMDTMRLPYAKARRLQKDYYRDHGTTLNGLMNLHGVDPDHFLSIVHKIDYSPVSADRRRRVVRRHLRHPRHGLPAEAIARSL